MPMRYITYCMYEKCKYYDIDGIQVCVKPSPGYTYAAIHLNIHSLYPLSIVNLEPCWLILKTTVFLLTLLCYVKHFYLI